MLDALRRYARRHVRRRVGARRAFTLLESALALAALMVLSGTAVLAGGQAQLEFEHNSNRLVVQNFVSAASADAAVRGQVYNPELLPLYSREGRFKVGGVERVLTGLADVSERPGDLVVWIRADYQMIAVSMLSTRGRCLTSLAVAGEANLVSSDRFSPCRPPLPDAVLLAADRPDGATPRPPTGLVAFADGSQAQMSWAPQPGMLFLVTVSPGGQLCVTPSTSCLIELPPGSHTVSVAASDGQSISSASAAVVLQIPSAGP